MEINKYLVVCLTKNNYPNKVYINGLMQDVVNYTYLFNKSDNYVELFWEHNKINCDNMFRECYHIYEINFPNFDTSQVTTMKRMFSHCTSLTSLNLLNFNTSNVQEMQYMFYKCGKISTLDLSNFDNSKVTYIDDIFDECSNLIYLNLKNFKEFKFVVYAYIFNSVPQNIFICGNESLISPQISKYNRECYIIDCSDDWQSKQKKMIGSQTCIDRCENHDIYKYEYNGKCVQECSNGFYVENNIKYCKCENVKCLICTSVALSLNLCNKCNDNYYPKENDESNYGEYIQCYKEISGYYLDSINKIFKKCYNSCQSCEIEGNSENHHCLNCDKNFSFEIKKDNYLNCYINCTFYYYFDKENNYHCTSDQTCPKEYARLINNIQCIKNDINYLNQNIDKIEKTEKNETKTEQKKEEIKYYDIVINKAEEIFTSDNYDTSKIDKGENEVINVFKIKIAFRTTQNSKVDTNDNLTKIDLGECETLLRIHYNISKIELIYLKQTEIEQEGIKIKKVEYDIYSRLSNSYLIKLNLTSCENTKMTLSVPIAISESLDKLNISSGYYNDICYTTTSDSGTDMTLSDRKKEYMKGNQIICQEGCDFKSYDYKTQEANCSCEIKESSSSFAYMDINTTKLYEKFIDINNILNISIMICYNVLFSKEGLLHNIAFYAIIIIIIFHLVSIIIFYKSKINIIKDKIKDISYGINNWNIVIEYQKEIIRKKKEKEKQRKKKLIIAKKEKTKKEEKKIKLLNPLDYYYLNRLLNKKNPPNKKNKEISINQRNDNNNGIKNPTSYINMSTEGMNKMEIVKKTKEIMSYNDEEMNNLSYKSALKIDKRSYCQYYLSLLKTKHILIFSFYNHYNNYNSQIVKILDLSLIFL